MKEPFEKKDAGKPAISDFKKPSPEPINMVPAIPSKNLEADLFRRGKEVLGKSAGGVIANLLKAKGGSVPQARSIIEIASEKQDAREYVGRILRGASEAKTGADLAAEQRARGERW